MIPEPATRAHRPGLGFPARAVVAVVRFLVGYVATIFRHLFVDQARAGRLRRIDWPRGLRPIVVLALGAYFVAVALIFASGFLRDRLDLAAVPGARTLALPEAPMWLILFLVLLSLSLTQTGALHAAPWLRVAGVAFTSLCVFYNSGFIASGHAHETATNLLSGGVCLALVGLTALRWRRRFAWWEFCVVLPLVTAGMVVPLAVAQADSSRAGVVLLPLALSLTFQVVGQLAVPLSVAAGVSAAELAMGAATRTAEYVRVTLPGRVLGGLFGLLVAWRMWSSWTDLRDEPSGELGRLAREHLGAALLIAAVIGTWFGLHRLAERQSTEDGTELHHLMMLKTKVALPTSAVLTIFLLPVVLLVLGERTLDSFFSDSSVGRWMSDVAEDLSSESAIRVARIVAGAIFVMAATVLARRGRRGLFESAATIGLVVLALYATEGRAVFSSIAWQKESLEHVGLAFVIVLAVWWGITRTFTVRRLTALLALVLLAALLPDSDFVSDPVAALLGFAGVGFVLFGFIWRLLSDSGPANETSSGFPREVRVLLLLAYNLFAVTVLAFSALARDPGAGIDLGAFAVLGAELLGTAILLGAFATVALSALRDRPLLEQAPPAPDPPSYDEAVAEAIDGDESAPTVAEPAPT